MADLDVLQKELHGAMTAQSVFASQMTNIAADLAALRVDIQALTTAHADTRLWRERHQPDLDRVRKTTDALFDRVITLLGGAGAAFVVQQILERGQ